MDYLVRKKEEKVKLLMKQSKRIPSNRVVSLYLGSIRHLFNEARKQYNDYDRDMILISHSPFDNFKIPKQEATRKRAISAERALALRQQSRPFLRFPSSDPVGAICSSAIRISPRLS